MKENAQKKRDYHYRLGDINPIPKCKNRARRRRCEKNLDKFLKTYLPHLCYRSFSKDQTEVVKGLQKSILKTGKKAKALPRGGGKTTLGIGAIIWALLYGHRSFPAIIGPSEGHANNILKDIKAELETNELLLADFPEVCYPIYKLEGRHARTRSQHCNGDLTKIEWTASQITLPIVKGSKVSGSILKTAGITSSFRGMKHGEKRPDFALLDDPQTRESAESVRQTTSREETINGDILGLAGHDKAISVYMTCTVIVRGDLSDRFLDREAHPDWHGKRAKLVYRWPASKLWEEYDKLWRQDHLSGDAEQKGATAYYKKHRRAMDKGAKIADENLYDESFELSAVQHAHNLRLSVGVSAFEAEYQNSPKAREFSLYEINPKLVRSRINGMKKHEIDRDAKLVVSFCDINFSGLHWSLIAFRNDSTGFVIDYGKIPERGVLVPENSNDTDQKKLIYAGLTKYVSQLNSLRLSVQIRAAAIDRGFKPEVVHQFCRNTQAKFVLLPAKGFGCTQYRPTSKTVGKPGIQCHITESYLGQFFAANSCYFREIAQRGFLSPPGQSGSMSFYGKDGMRHAGISEHLCAEILTDKAEGKNGQVFWRWGRKPGTVNDWLDTVTGCRALATWFLGDVPVDSTVGGRGKTKKSRKRRKRRKAKVEIED